MDKFINGLNTVWSWLDGKKTKIGLLLVLLSQLDNMDQYVNPDFVSWAQQIGLFLGGSMAITGGVHGLIKSVKSKGVK